MINPKRIFVAMAIALAGGSLPNALAADASSERTRMPDFCSNRDVTCLLPDGGGAVRSVPAQTSGIPGTSTGTTTGNTGPAGSTVVITPPVSSTGGSAGFRTPGVGGSAPATASTPANTTVTGPTVPSVPALPGAVPGFTGNVPSATSGGTASGTTSSTTSGSATGTTAGATNAGSGTGTTGATSGSGGGASFGGGGRR